MTMPNAPKGARRPNRTDWLDYTRLLAWATTAEADAAGRVDRDHRDAYRWKLGRRSLRNEYRQGIAPALPTSN